MRMFFVVWILFSLPSQLHLASVASGQILDEQTRPQPPTAPAAPRDPVSSMTSEEAEAMARDIIPLVEEIRGLKFKKPVPVKVVDDAGAAAHFQARLAKFWPEDQMRAQQAAYTQLGLLPAATDLKGTLFALLEEQAGAYYDPDSDTFFVLNDMPRSSAPILMAHELTHALDDQHYGIDALLEKAKMDDERSSLVAAVVEGSGTLVMSAFLIREVQAGRLKMDILQELSGSEAGKAQRLRASPQVMQRGLLAPYLLGQTFVLRGDATRVLHGVQAADIDRMFRDPPVSTEQLLHPEKYWDEALRDLPRPVTLPDLTVSVGAGWSLKGSGSLGEMTLALLAGAEELDFKSVESTMPSRWTNAAAAGWGGDQWQLYASGDRMVVVLATLWDSEKDAAEFEAALSAYRGGTLRHRRRGDALVLVAGDAGEGAEKLAEAALRELKPPASTTVAAP